MTKFEVIQPSAILSPFVAQYWFLEINDAGCCSQRYIPSGYTSLVFHRGERIYSTLHREIQPQSGLCGQSLLYTDIVYSGYLNFIMVVFRPNAARIIFGIPMYELRNWNIDTGQLGESSLYDLENRLINTTDNRQCTVHIENFLLKKLSCIVFDNNKFDRMNEIVRCIVNGQQNITQLSTMACLGYKQFKRVFAEYAGLNPKEFIQIARFRKVLYCLHSGLQTNLNELAYNHGYSDKSHLIKDFKTFTGYTPKKYLSICDPYCEYLSLFNSIFINGGSEKECGVP